MAPKMSVVRKLLLGSPASFKQQRKSEAARSSTPYKICSSRKATNLPPKPTRHRAKRLEAANQLRYLDNHPSDFGLCLVGRDETVPAITQAYFESALPEILAR